MKFLDRPHISATILVHLIGMTYFGIAMTIVERPQQEAKHSVAEVQPSVAKQIPTSKLSQSTIQLVQKRSQ